MRQSLAINGIKLDVPHIRALRDAIALVGGASSACKLLGVHRMQLYRCLKGIHDIAPEHARTLSKECDYRIKIDEMCPETFGKLHHRELSYTVRK